MTKDPCVSLGYALAVKTIAYLLAISSGIDLKFVKTSILISFPAKDLPTTYFLNESLIIGSSKTLWINSVKSVRV